MTNKKAPKKIIHKMPRGRPEKTDNVSNKVKELRRQWRKASKKYYDRIRIERKGRKERQ